MPCPVGEAQGNEAPGVLAAQTATDDSTVRRRIRTLRLVALAIAPFQSKSTDAEILTLREAGLWASQIVARTGMTTAAVKMRLQ